MKHGTALELQTRQRLQAQAEYNIGRHLETEVCELAYLEAGQVRLDWLKGTPHCGAKAFEVRERLRMATGTAGS